VTKILLVGDDFRLLATRAALLTKTGASTVCCSAAEMQKDLEGESFNLAVLCHSLSEEDARSSAALVHRRWPEAKVFLVESSVSLNKTFEGVALDGMISSAPSALLAQMISVLGALPKSVVPGVVGAS
jgi:DNA-binding response OmpR family regulator